MSGAKYAKQIAETLKARAPLYLSAHGYNYKETGNPLFAWHALKLCRNFDLQYPEWLTEYLNEAADLILDVRDESAREAQRIVNKGLGFGDGVNRSQYQQYREYLLRMDIAAAGDQLENEGYKPGKIKDATAKHFGDRWREIMGTEGPTDRTIER